MRALVLAVAISLIGCNKPTEPAPSGKDGRTPSGATGNRTKAAPSAPVPMGETPVPPAEPVEVTWAAPSAWTKSDRTSPMRKATYTVPRAPGDPEDGDLSVSQAGGSVDQNVARWATQFDAKPEDAKRSTRTVDGLRVTVVEIHGSYAGMAMPGAPPLGKKSGWALLGAIVEPTPNRPGAAIPTFFKLTGPEKTVALARADFDKLVESLRAK